MTKSILIVDDERHVRTLLEHALDSLEELGVEIASASSVAEAMEKAAACRPALAFIDVSMPDECGYDLCTTLRTALDLPNLHVVLLHEVGQEPDPERCLGSFVDHLAKPFDPDRVLELSCHALGIDPGDLDAPT